MRPQVADALRETRLTLVDIGARGGLSAHWAKVGPSLHVVAFDANPEEARRLDATVRRTGATVQVIAAAVWDRTGNRTLHLTRSPACSSLFPPTTDFLRQFPQVERFDVTSRIEVEIVPLDSVLDDPRTGPVRFVKIDAQGGAFPVLQGAVRTLQTAIGFEIELEFAAIYQDQPLFGEVDGVMRAAGFELVNLRPTYWRRAAARSVPGTRGQLIFGDALYMLSPRLLAERLTRAAPDAARHIAASALTACDVYGLDDWVVAYADAAATVDATSPMFRDAAAAAAHGRGSSRLPGFPGRYALGLWLKDLGDALVEAPAVWAVAEQRLASKPRLSRGLAAKLFGRRG